MNDPHSAENRDQGPPVGPPVHHSAGRTDCPPDCRATSCIEDLLAQLWRVGKRPEQDMPYELLNAARAHDIPWNRLAEALWQPVGQLIELTARNNPAATPTPTYPASQDTRTSTP